MVRYIKPKKSQDFKRQEQLEQQFTEKIERVPEEELSASLSANRNRLETLLGSNSDLVYREFRFEREGMHKAMIVFIDGLISSKAIDQDILRSLMFMQSKRQPFSDPESIDTAAQQLMNEGVPIGEVKETKRFRDIVKTVLSGDTALLIDGCPEALLLSTKGWEKRSVEGPFTESVVRGPREGFTETLRVNTALIRKHLKDPDLRVKNYKIGTRSNTDVAVLYIEGVAMESVIQEVDRRLKEIETDGILESGYIEQFIEDSHWSPFPLIQNTERSDKAVANLLEGRVLIIVDGSPFALIVPSMFTQLYQSPEDYYERFLIATLLRFIRWISMTMALMLPALYIAFSSFHPEMIPSKLVTAMAAGRATVPFPSLVEAMAMEVSIEILREASVRLPGPIGPTIGIVGALIIGEASVRAGIVSPIMVIIVALTTIGSFAVPSYNAAIALRMLRFPMMLLASVLGLYGIMLFVILIVIYLCSLKSFGTPYLAPMSPTNLLQMGDSLIRIPLYRMIKRPSWMAKRTERKRTDTSSAEGVKPNEPTDEKTENDQRQ